MIKVRCYPGSMYLVGVVLDVLGPQSVELLDPGWWGSPVWAYIFEDDFEVFKELVEAECPGVTVENEDSK